MKFLPAVAVLLVLAEAGASVAFLIRGPLWLGLVLAVALGATLGVVAVARRRRLTPSPTAGYVEREAHFY